MLSYSIYTIAYRLKRKVGDWMLVQDDIQRILDEKQLKRDTYNLIANKDTIQQFGEQYGNILNRTTLIKMLDQLKSSTTVVQRTTLSTFTHYLVNILELFSEVSIFSEWKENKVKRYVSTSVQVSPYEIALSLLSGSFLSHYSALFVHDLTLNNPKDIYINREQTEKPVNKENAQLTQRRIDYAFSKEMRHTNQTYNFTYQHIQYRVHVLNAKNTKKTGIITQHPIGFSKPIQVTNVERTLLDCMVRPKYSGGATEILEAFHHVQPKVDIQLLNQYLDKFNYIYPYEKALWFYLKKNQYSDTDIQVFKEKTIHGPFAALDFYLDYQIVDKKKDADIGIFYPSAIDQMSGGFVT